MAKSTAKAESWARDLKEKLQYRGFTVAQSNDSAGYPKLVLNTDEASISFAQEDAVSKDVFGNDLLALTPHKLSFASRNDAMTSLKVAQILAETGKLGIKTIIKTHADTLATAEASAGTALEVDVRFPTKGQ